MITSSPIRVWNTGPHQGRQPLSLWVVSKTLTFLEALRSHQSSKRLHLNQSSLTTPPRKTLIWVAGLVSITLLRGRQGPVSLWNRKGHRMCSLLRCTIEGSPRMVEAKAAHLLMLQVWINSRQANRKWLQSIQTRRPLQRPSISCSKLHHLVRMLKWISRPMYLTRKVFLKNPWWPLSTRQAPTRPRPSIKQCLGQTLRQHRRPRSK